MQIRRTSPIRPRCRPPKLPSVLRRLKFRPAKPRVETASINLSFTRIVSPIDGIAGIAQAQVGDLVSTSSGVLTTVSTLDPIRDYFTVSEQEYLALQKRFSNPDKDHWKLQLILADGTTYPHAGEFYFADRQVNQNTGAIQLAALFANPGNVLRPGQYGKVRAMIRVQRNALLIPQAAVNEQQGSYLVAVVDKDNHVSMRPVQVGERTDTMWVIQSGLKPGERVVVEGQQNLQPGMTGTNQAIQERRRVTADRLDQNAKGIRIMSKFFINRPIVAMVIAILTVIVGAITIATLPVAQFPNIAPPEIRLQANYPGADAQDSRASGCRAHRAASQRRGQHDLHVLPERHRQPANDVSCRFRSQD